MASAGVCLPAHCLPSSSRSEGTPNTLSIPSHNRLADDLSQRRLLDLSTHLIQPASMPEIAQSALTLAVCTALGNGLLERLASAATLCLAGNRLTGVDDTGKLTQLRLLDLSRHLTQQAVRHD